MKKIMVLIGCLVFAFGMMSGVAQAAGKKSEALFCPSCKIETTKHKAPPKGVTHTHRKHLCPSCGQFHEGKSTTQIQHICEKCGAEIVKCSVCSKKDAKNAK